LFRHSVAETKAKELKDAFTSPSVAIKLIRDMFKLSESELKIWLGGSKLPKLVGRCRYLVCWLTWVYRDLNPERVLNMWNHMEKKRYSTGNLKATARYRLGEELTKDMLIHLRDDGPKPGYLKRTGMTPFFTGAQIVEDSSLCDFFKCKLEPTESDTEEVRQRKKLLVTCVLTVSEKHQGGHDYLSGLFEDTKEALKFAKSLVKSIGIDVHSSERRVPGGAGRKRLQVVVQPEGVLALALALKDKFRKPLLEILPTLLGTSNLSILDKEWVQDSVTAHNEACEAANERELEIILDGCGVIIGVIASRVREANAERAFGGGTAATTGNDEEVRTARTLIGLQGIRVDAVDEMVAQQSHQRRLDRAARVVEEEVNDDDDDDNDDNDNDNDENDNDNERGDGGGLVLVEARRARFG
jgi:hypothetical protein